MLASPPYRQMVADPYLMDRLTGFEPDISIRLPARRGISVNPQAMVRGLWRDNEADMYLTRALSANRSVTAHLP